MQEKERCLINELEKAPIVEVTGLVDGLGVAGAQLMNQKRWTMRMTFAGWRVNGGSLVQGTLNIQKNMGRVELDRLIDSIEPYEILTIKALYLERSSKEPSYALLKRIVGTGGDDQDLLNIANKFQQPLKVVDPYFGKLKFERDGDQYSTPLRWNEKKVLLLVNAGQEKLLVKGLETAQELWKAQKRWTSKIENFIVKELLPVKNSAWLDEGEKRLTSKEFKEKLTLQTIDVSAKGAFGFGFNDGNLFLGHSIYATGKISKGVLSADLSG